MTKREPKLAIRVEVHDDGRIETWRCRGSRLRWLWQAVADAIRGRWRDARSDIGLACRPMRP